MKTKLIAVLLAVCLLCGCSLATDTEALLRAPQLSGESRALQKALNSYLNSAVTLKYPNSGDFLSPFAFGDWDGDGQDEAAVLYAADSTGTNVWLAVLEAETDGGWRVSQTVEGLSGEVEVFSAAHLRDSVSQQLIAGYTSAQGDSYLVVYRYADGQLTTVISQSYTHMILADFTGKGDTQDLVLALPAESDFGGVALQLLTNVDGEFRSAQTLNLGEGVYTGCAALQAGRGIDEHTYLVMDAYSDSGSLVSDIITYDEETGFLQSYHPPGVSSVFNSTRRYDTTLFSCDIDQNGTVDIPVEAEDGGSITSPLDKRLRFVVWQDYAGENGGKSTFGVYDAANRVFFGLPSLLRKNVMLRPFANGSGWQLCNLTGTVTYCELRMVEANDADNEEFTRIANVGSQQLQARVLTSYAGLTEEYIQKHTVLLGAE